MPGKRRRVAVLIPLFIAFLFLSACGSKEGQRGIDGYIYVSEELPLTGASNFKSRGGYLYYCDNSKGDSVYRIDEELLLSGLEEKEEDSAQQNGEKTVLNGILAASNGENGRILGYTVGGMGDIYYYLAETEFSASWQQEIKSGMLVRRSEDGRELYRRDLQLDYDWADLQRHPLSLAVNDREQVFMLAGNVIYVIDPEGKTVCQLEMDSYCSDSGNAQAQLAEGSEGQIYYIMEDTSLGILEVYEILEENAGSGTDFRLERMTAFREEMRTVGSYGTIFGSFGGLLYNDKDGILKQYGAQDNSRSELLRWSDSNLTGDPAEVVWLSEEYMIACFHEYWASEQGSGVYLLTRKAVSELPEKEELTLAYTYASPYLEQRIVEFNRKSDLYHITPKIYEKNGARLDAELVSSNPPDILDLTYMDAGKYAGKGLLEDLTPYLKGSSALDIEQYWEGILEAYTVDGKLTCLPGSFGISVIMGRKSQLSGLEEWNMEAVIALSEKYPDARLMNMDSFYYVLEELCCNYILEKYIDWEKGECTFDQGEFGKLMLWLEKHTGRIERVSGEGDYEGGIVPEDILLMQTDWNSWMAPMQYEMAYQGDMAAVGYPSRSGEALYYGKPYDLIGIVSGSGHKEGAWEFLEYYLAGEDSEERFGFPVQKDVFAHDLEEQMTPEYLRDEKGEIRMAWGEPVMKSKGGFEMEGEMVEYYCITREQAELLTYAAEHAVFSLDGEVKAEVLDIIIEEINDYLYRKKTLEETTKIIQNRAQLLVQERLK